MLISLFKLKTGSGGWRRFSQSCREQGDPSLSLCLRLDWDDMEGSGEDSARQEREHQGREEGLDLSFHQRQTPL